MILLNLPFSTVTLSPFAVNTISPGINPAAFAGDGSTTTSMRIRFVDSGQPVENVKTRMMKLTIRFAPGPAANTAKRTRLGDADNPFSTVGSSSPAGRTKPPSGIQLKERIIELGSTSSGT